VATAPRPLKIIFIMRRILGLLLLIVGVIVAIIGLGAVFFVLMGQGVPGLFGPFVVLGIAGVVSAIIGVYLMRSGRNLGPKQVAVGGRVGRYLVDISERRYLDGKLFETLYLKQVPGKNGRPSSLLVKVPVQAPTTLQFNMETRFDRFAKRIGLAREHQTGDEDFDAAVYIRGPSLGFAELYLEAPEKRAAVLGLLAAGFNEVRVTDSAIEALWNKFNPLKDDTPELIEDTARNVMILADQVPADDPDDAASRTDWGRRWTILLWVLAVAWAAALTFVFVYEPVRFGDLLLPALNVLTVAYSIFVVTAAFLLKGTSISHDRWGPLAGFGLVLAAVGSVGVVAGCNALADDNLPVEQRALVLNKHLNSGRHGTSYHATVVDWARPGQTINFKVSSGEYHALVPNRSHLLVTTSPGKFGIEWVKQVRIVP
jgi:hypothetical protein